MKTVFQISLASLLILMAVSNTNAQVSHRLSDDEHSAASSMEYENFETGPYGEESSAFQQEEIWPEGIESDREEERERIETDRHDFTQSALVVGKGVTQIEFGYSFFQNSGEAEIEDSHTTPEMLIRYGLTEKVELRLRYNQVWQFGEEDRSGSEDLRLAFKIRTTDQRDLRPESALEIRFTAPTGGSDWSTDEVEFGLDYIYGWKISPRTEIYGSSGFSTNALGEFAFRPTAPANEEFMLYTQSFAIGTELTEYCTVYNEVFGLFTDGFEDDEERPVFYNIGLDFYLTDNFVLDIRAGTGLNRDAEDLFFGMGGGFRF